MSDPIDRAKLVTAGELRTLVSEVVKSKVVKATGHPILRWDIAGYVVRQTEAQDFANKVSSHLGDKGIHVTPAVLTIGGETLAGFIENAARVQNRFL